MAEQGPGRRPTVSDEEILDVFRQADDPVLTTAEVADQLAIKRRGTYDRLQQLVENGELRMKQSGGTGTVWWHPDSLRERYTK